MTTKAYVDIHGRNKTDRAFNKVESNVSKLDNSFKKLNAGIAAFGTGIALLKLVSLGKSSIDSADKIDKLSTRLGASSEALSQYRHVASQAGIEFNTLTMGWQRMTRRVAEAAKGTGEAKGALIELGISAKALNKLAPDQQFEALADALQKVENPADRVRLSMKLFDSEGVSLIQTMKGGAAGIREVREEADRLGLTLSEKQTRGAADAKDAIDRLTSSISGPLMQSMIEYSGQIASLANFFEKTIPLAISATVSAFNTIGPALLPAISVFVGLRVVLPILVAITAKAIALNASLVTTQVVTTKAGASVGLMGVGMTTATTQVVAMTTAQKLQTIAARGLTASVGLLRGGMALLGGPAGVIALAVSALIIFSNKSRQAKADTDRLIASINEMSKGADLGGNLVKINAEIARLERGVKGATISVRNLTAQWGVNAGATKKEQKRLDGLVSSLANAKKASSSLTKQIQEQEKITKQLSSATSGLNNNIFKLGLSTKQLAIQKKALATIMTASTKASNQLAKATGVNLLKTQTQLNKAVAQAQIKHVNYNKALQAAHNTVIKQAAPGTKAYTRLMQALGFNIAKTAAKTKKSTSAMAHSWKQFSDSAIGALERFYRSGLSGTKSFTDSVKDLFKDMIASVLAQITKLIAGNAFKKLVAFLSGKTQTTGLFSGLGSLLGLGGSSSSPTGPAGPSGVSSLLSGLSGIFKGLFGGTTSAAGPVKPGLISGLFTSGGIFSSTGSVGSLFSAGGLFGKGGAIASSFGNLTALINPVTAAIAAVAFLGGPLISKLFGGGRSPQELAEDQLSAVDQATKEGRNEQVQLGQAAGTAVSFLGGFDEFSTFFGIDKAKDDIQQIGDIFKANFGGDALLAVKDGILRIEDTSREFSENNDEIVAQVKASIIEFELQFTKTEKSILASLGSSITGVDELFDSMKDSGLSTSEKLIRSYSQFFNKTKAEGEQWLASSGVQADRWAQIFDSATGPVLSQLVGLGNAGVQSFNDIANSATSLSSDIIGLNDALSETARRQSNIVPIGSQKPTNIPQIPNGNNVVPINGAQGGQANGNQGLSPDAAAIVAEMREQTEEMRAARTAPGGR